MKAWSYTSTAPMGLTACTEPECLYKCELYLTFTCRVQDRSVTTWASFINLTGILWKFVRPQILVAAWFKACGCSLAGIAGSNAAGGMVFSRECCVLSGRGHCDWPIFHPEESCHVCVCVCVCVCVSLSVISCNNDPLHLTMKMFKEVRIKTRGRE
jgi:hypothetical protein